MTSENLKSVINEHPNLKLDGLDADGDQNELLKFEKAFKVACEWLTLVVRTKVPNRKMRTSYQLKHAVEYWYERKYKKACYIPEGIFIAAAYFLGFNITHRKGSPSVYLNISSLNRLYDESL